jgi:acyl-CoA dehydrogenase
MAFDHRNERLGDVLHKDQRLNAAAIARDLGSQLLAECAAMDERALTDTAIRRLRQERLLWPSIAATNGADAAWLESAVRIVYEIARVTGSAGLIVAMHMSQAMTLLRHSRGSPFLESLLERSMDRQSLVASGTSEKGVGGDVLTSICRVVPEEGGYALTKDSPNISYLDLADVLLATALHADQGGATRQVLIGLTTDQIETDPGSAESLLGMRGILNRPYRLTARFAAEAIFPEPYPLIARTTMTPTVHLFWSALWSGIAANVLGKARSAVTKESRSNAGPASAKATDFSRLVNKHYIMNALIRDALVELSGLSSASPIGLVSTARVKRLKVVCSDLIDDICQGALALIGLPGYSEQGPLSIAGAVRDALSASILISNYRLVEANAQVERYVEETI